MACAQPVLLNEVIEEILSWVPVKSLVRFKCVCKYWKSLISNPHFVKLHLQRSPKNASLILTLQTRPSLHEYDFRVMFCSIGSLIQNPLSTIIAHDRHFRLKNKYWVLGSSNGLVCLCGSQECEIGKYWVRFWNPAMRLRSKKSPCIQVNLCKNQAGFTVFGFGYDKSSDTYKVVAVIAFGQSKTTEVKVYSMGGHCWRDIERFPAFPIIFRNMGIFLSGTLNWLASRNFTPDYNWDEFVIVSLDLEKETYKQLSLPVGIGKTSRFAPTIGILEDCLCLYDFMGTHFVLWQVKEFGVEKSWTQFVNLSFEHLQIAFMVISLSPLCILENGDVLLLLNDNFEIILYNRRDNTVEHIEIGNNGAWIDAMDYVQSLVLPC